MHPCFLVTKEDLAAVAKMHCFSSLPLAGNREEGSVGLAGLSCRRGFVSVLLRCLSWQFLKMRLEDTGNICVGFPAQHHFVRAIRWLRKPSSYPPSIPLHRPQCLPSASPVKRDKLQEVRHCGRAQM